MSDILIKANGLSVGFQIGNSIFKRQVLKAVDNVTLEIEKGSFFGLVGESGSGKTTLGRALLKAVPITGGGAHYSDGEVAYDLEDISKENLKDYRKRAQLIFQDPYASLNSRMNIFDIIGEPLLVIGGMKNREERTKRVAELLRPGGEIELTDHVQFDAPNELLVYNTRDYNGISRNFEQDLLRYYARKLRKEIPMTQWGLGLTSTVSLRKVTTPAGITELFAIPSWRQKELQIQVQTDAVTNLENVKLTAQIFDQDGQLVFQLPVMSNKVKINKNVFGSGKFKLGFILDGETDIHFTEVNIK